MSKKFPNILFFGIDSLRRDRMSLYGYPKLTTPHIDAFLAEDSIVFDNMFSPSIPTTPGYASMLSGKDCFGTNVVALRHEGGYLPFEFTLDNLVGEHDLEVRVVLPSSEADLYPGGSLSGGPAREAELVRAALRHLAVGEARSPVAPTHHSL